LVTLVVTSHNLLKATTLANEISHSHRQTALAENHRSIDWWTFKFNYLVNQLAYT